MGTAVNVAAGLRLVVAWARPASGSADTVAKQQFAVFMSVGKGWGWGANAGVTLATAIAGVGLTEANAVADPAVGGIAEQPTIQQTHSAATRDFTA
jgi:hypothetical protein